MALNSIRSDSAPRKGRLAISLAFAIAGGMLPAASIGAGMDFVSAPNVPTGLGPHEVALGDLDRDGDLDVVSADITDLQSGTMSVLINAGDGTFASPVSYPVGAQSQYVALADFNGDGYPDAVVVNTLSDTVSVLLNNGNGTFAPRQDYSVGNYPQQVAVADFTGDLVPDLAIVCLTAGWVEVLRGLGNGQFVLRGRYSLGLSPRALDKGDFNRDGRPDLVIATGDFIVLLYNTGPGFSAPVYFNTFTERAECVAAGDFNLDGAPDFASTGAVLSVFRNDGAGNFPTKTTYPSSSSALGIRAADMDGDGTLDLVTANYLGNSVSVYSNGGAGTFDFKRDWGVGPAPWSVGVGDLNGDGMRDIVAPNSQASQTNVTVALNVGNREFLARRDYRMRGSGQGVAIADFNRDGYLDVAAGGGLSNADTVNLFLGNPDGTLKEPIALENLGNNLPTDVVSGDFNRDGWPDFAVSIFSPGNRVRVFLNRGNGTFFPSVSYAAGGNPSSVATGDLNGDAWPDIVCSNGSRLDNTISVFFNNRDGTFATGIRYPTLTAPSDVAIGDLDRDGDLDLVVSHRDSVGIRILKNDGFGSFTGQNFSVGEFQASVAIGDLDRDSWPDIAFGMGSSSNPMGTIGILRNDRSGWFIGPVPTPLRGTRVAIHDLNRDGHPDLAATAGVFGLLRVAENDNEKFFTNILVRDSGYETDRFDIGDLDRDGWPDVVTANVRAGSISVHLNATDAITAKPWFLSVGPGLHLEGGVDRLFASDDSYVVTQLNLAAEETGYPITAELLATSPGLPPSSLRFELEARAEIEGIGQTIELFDWSLNRFVAVDTRFASTSDSTVIATPAGDVSRFVQARTRRIRARLGWEPLFVDTADPWRVWIDRAVLRIGR